MKTTEKPVYQHFHIDGVNHISSLNAMEAIHCGEAVLLDVREEYEYKVSTVDIEAVLYQPMSSIIDNLSRIPSEKAIIIICTSGERSTKIANLLNRSGFEQVANLDGGIINWIESGLPYKSRLSVNCGCGCKPAEPEEVKSGDDCGCSSGCGTGCC